VKPVRPNNIERKQYGLWKKKNIKTFEDTTAHRVEYYKGLEIMVELSLN